MCLIFCKIKYQEYRKNALSYLLKEEYKVLQEIKTFSKNIAYDSLKGKIQTIDHIENIMKNHPTSEFTIKSIIFLFLIIGSNKEFFDHRLFFSIRDLFNKVEELFLKEDNILYKSILKNFCKFLISIEMPPNSSYISQCWSIIDIIEKNYKNEKILLIYSKILRKKRANNLLKLTIKTINNHSGLSIKRIFDALEDKYIEEKQKKVFLKILIRISQNIKFKDLERYLYSFKFKKES